MKRLIILFALLIAMPCEARMNVGIVGGGVRTGINDFATDSNCVALYNFESGSLTTDSKGTNTLTDVNTVGTDTTNYKQGTASAVLVYSDIEYFTRTDTNLSSDFPLKNGTSNNKISVCAWFRAVDLTTAYNDRTIVAKYDAGTANKRSFILEVGKDGTDDKVALTIGYNSGASSEGVYHQTVISTLTWYHVTATFDNSDKSYSIRLRDTSGNTVGSDLTGNFTNNITINDSPFFVGNFYFEGAAYDTINWSGQLDEVVIFKDIITSAEATSIAKGLYP